MDAEYYNDVYLKRLNRYGIDFQSRMQRQREEKPLSLEEAMKRLR